MKITVDGKDSPLLASYIRDLLEDYGVPAVFEGFTPTSSEWLQREVTKLASRLEEPVQVFASDRDGRHWSNYLEIDKDVLVVKGTWVTARHVVDLVADGWSWQDILRTHPELCDDDIRACLNYTLQEEGDNGPDEAGLPDDDGQPEGEDCGHLQGVENGRSGQEVRSRPNSDGKVW